MRTIIISTILAALLSCPWIAVANPNDPPLTDVNKPPALLPELDPDLPHYIPLTGQVKGTIRIAGPELLERLMRRWGADFQAIYPRVKVEIGIRKTADVFSQLVAQEADLVVMPREPNRDESKAFIRARGQAPTPLAFGGDMQAVIVNRQNPIAGLTMNQLATIYGHFTDAQADQDLTHWTQLGVQKSASLSPIHPYGRQAGTEEYANFRSRVLQDLPLKQQVVAKEDSAAVVRAVAADPLGIGYVSRSQSMAGVRVIPLARQAEFFAPTNENFLIRYPWGRMLYLTTPLLQTDPIPDRVDPLVAQFIRFVYSQEGQSGLVREGFVSLSERRASNGRYTICPRPVRSR